MGAAEDRDARTDDREALGEDVEGHGLAGSPLGETPTSERADEGDDDVEAHGMVGSPNIESPKGE